LAVDAVRVRPAELVFVLPAYNEEENLPRLLEDFAVRTELLARTSRVLIVDDGSEDATADLVDAYDGDVPAEVIRMARTRARCRVPRRLRRALAQCSDDALIVTLESDTTSDLDALPLMVERAEAGADLVLASWVMQGVSRRRRFLSAAAGWVIRHTLGLQATTVSSFLPRLPRVRPPGRRGEYGEKLVQETGFACKAELLAKLSALGATVEEVRGRPRLDPPGRQEQDAVSQDDRRLLADDRPAPSAKAAAPA
jgi:dolichol-phosphate mannosyltransferase